MLSIRNVCVNYGPIKAVRNVDLDITTSEIVTLLGANGAGKSSLLRAIMSLEAVSSGTIEFEGRNITGMATEIIVKQHLTLSPEGRQVFAALTILENLKLGAAINQSRHRSKQNLEMVYDLFPILQNRSNQLAGTLSGGEQQQLAIARALMSNPKLLMLDEPSLGLAPVIVTDMFESISRLRDKGLTILLVEQNAEMSLQIADRGYVFTNGKISMSGTSKELRSHANIRAAYLGGETDHV